MTKTRKTQILLAALPAAALAIPFPAYAMHIMEGALPARFCVAWGLICLPFLLAGFFSIRKTVRENRRAVTLLAMSGAFIFVISSLKNKVKENRRNLTLIAMSGAFIFVISSLKIPSVTGSCSHMTGTGLGAILFGPSAVSVLGILVLIFQAILLAHGGLTTLGANTFSMAIAGPFVSWLLYRILNSCRVNRKVSLFAAAFLGDLLTYCVTAFQLALAHNSATSFSIALRENLVIFAGTQIPLAVVEGLLTVAIVIGLESYARPELAAVGFLKEGAE